MKAASRSSSPRAAPSTPRTGIVVTVVRGGCEVFEGDRLWELRLTGRHAHSGIELAVGDDVTFDPERGVVLEVLPRRSELVRRRPEDDPRRQQVIAANMDRLAIVTSVVSPGFRPGLVDRLLLAARAGGLEAILVVNKTDLLPGPSLPPEVLDFRDVLPCYPTSAVTGEGLVALLGALRESRTVLAGHSGVGKSSLLNALEPELRLETGELRRAGGRGRHTTTSSTLYRLRGEAIVVDTPGVREVGVGAVDPEQLAQAYPDVLALASSCRFRDCRHDREPDCAVRDAAERGELSPGRLAGFQRLAAEVAAASSAKAP